MAAYKAEIHTVIIPKANRGDLDEVDETVKASTEFILASKLEEVLDNALCTKNVRTNSRSKTVIIPPEEQPEGSNASVTS